MRILHTADLHLGQILYQNYSRGDEHDHFFAQLEEWCGQYSPDVLLVSGDIFDIQQPGAAVKRRFNEYFVRLHETYPEMGIVITAGNHDSASRIHADNAVWKLGDIRLVGLPPSGSGAAGWQEEYVVRLRSGYVVAVPFTPTPKKEAVQALLDYVAAENTGDLPVVLMGHLAVTGMDATGHGFDVGHLQTVAPDELGDGYDYLALGHIHRPQTLGHADEYEECSTYPSGVIRYSGSPLHVSCDEKYPHSVSLVDIDHHSGTVTVQRLRVRELRHFYELPAEGSYASAEEALEGIRAFILQHQSGYIRLKMDYAAALPSDFTQQVYALMEPYGEEFRYNPKILWEGQTSATEAEHQPVFEVADLQQMTDPFLFVEQTRENYPELDIDDLRKAFDEVGEELRRMQEEQQGKNKDKTQAQP